MAHDNHVIDNQNMDINLTYPNRESYLDLTSGFKSKLPPLVVKKHSNIHVVREDLALPGGTKTRAAEFMFSQIQEDTVVYVVPRTGLAPSAIMDLCEIYGKKAVFFFPSSKEVSDHQAAVIARNPKEIHFRRIAAMPNLNRLAKVYAEDKGYRFLPFGLGHPYVIAGFVRACDDLLMSYEEPKVMWTAVSTGVLTRGIQIGFPNCKMNGVAVARNMKAGELGRTRIISDPLNFHTKERKENLPEFDTVPNYDGKVWKYIDDEPGTWFWNVAGHLECPKGFNKNAIDSYRDWDKNK